jgi:hypothetical protein
MPTVPAPAKTAIRLSRHVATVESPYTGRQQVLEWPYALWVAEVTMPPMKRDKAAAFQAFLMSCRGRAGTFLMGDRDAPIPRGTARSGVVVNGGGQTGNAINVRGMVNTSLLRGDYIQIGSGATSRLHMVVNDHGGGAGGTTPLEIEPALKFAPADGAAVTVVNAVGLWRMSVNELGWDSDHARVFGFSFSCHEAF